MGMEKPKTDVLPGRHLAQESARYRQVTGAVARTLEFAESNGEMSCARVPAGSVFDAVYGIGWIAVKGIACCGKRWNSTSSP